MTFLKPFLYYKPFTYGELAIQYSYCLNQQACRFYNAYTTADADTLAAFIYKERQTRTVCYRDKIKN